MQTYSFYIFDFDGTLTDTVSVWLGVFRDCLKQFGVTPPADTILAQHTHDWPEMLKLGLPEEKLADFIATARTLSLERLPQASLHTGALEMLATLQKAGKQLAVYTGMDRPIFEPVLKHQKIDAFIHVSVAGSDVAHRKPAPDGIFKALEELGVDKSQYKQAVYIGDRDVDILAAHNAGIDSILYFPPAHEATYDRALLEATKPTHIIHDWQTLTA